MKKSKFSKEQIAYAHRQMMVALQAVMLAGRFRASELRELRQLRDEYARLK